jgi:hypothetical protein
MIKNIKIYIVLYSIFTSTILCAKTIDLLEDNQPIINTDQLMNDGSVNKLGLDAEQTAFKTSKVIDNIKTCDYRPNKICKVVIRERMPTIIRLPKYEWINDWVLGDDINFELDTINNLTNAISIKSYQSEIDTNLNIIGGSGLIYPFYIKSNNYRSKQISDFIVNIKADAKTMELISQAKRFYKDNPIPDESLDDIKSFKLKNHALHSAFRKMLPKDWNLDIDKKLQGRDRLFDAFVENQTRRQAILDLAEQLNLKAMFYPKLRLLVITDNNEVIE